MSLNLFCDVCERRLKQAPGMIYSPSGPIIEQFYICRRCWPTLKTWFEDRRKNGFSLKRKVKNKPQF